MKTSKGFTLIEGLLILVIVGLIGGTGWYVWSSHNKTNSILSSADQVNNSVAIFNKKASGNVTLKIPELKIQFSVPSTLKDFTYKNAPPRNAVVEAMSTSEFDALPDNMCVSSDPKFVYTLGLLREGNGIYKADYDTLLKQFDNFYIAYENSLDNFDSCSSNKSVNEKISTLRTQLISALKNAQEIK